MSSSLHPASPGPETLRRAHLWALGEVRRHGFTQREEHLVEAVLACTLGLGRIESRIPGTLELRTLARLDKAHFAQVRARLIEARVLSVRVTPEGEVWSVNLMSAAWKSRPEASAAQMAAALAAVQRANGAQQTEFLEEPSLDRALAPVMAEERGREDIPKWIRALRAAVDAPAPAADPPAPPGGHQKGDSHHPEGDSHQNGDPRIRVHVNVPERKRTRLEGNGDEAAWLREQVAELIGPREWGTWRRAWEEQIATAADAVKAAVGEVRMKRSNGVVARKSVGQWLWWEFKRETGRV